MPANPPSGSAGTERLAAVEELSAFLADLPKAGHAVALANKVPWSMIAKLCGTAAAERSERLVTYPSPGWPLMDPRGFVVRLSEASPKGTSLVLVRAHEILRRRPVGFHLENERLFERWGPRRPRIVCVYDASVLRRLAPHEIALAAHKHQFLHPSVLG